MKAFIALVAFITGLFRGGEPGLSSSFTRSFLLTHKVVCFTMGVFKFQSRTFFLLLIGGDALLYHFSVTKAT